MKIQILPENVISKIAAGEVVERPSSVVKELLENAIDAGAKEITCDVRSEGLWSLRVKDDGCGMEREDLLLAIKRYATSKITRFENLFSIETLGFRGEALPSIGSVSRLEIQSKTRGKVEGISVRLEGGKIIEVQEVGCPAGTAVMVKDLFYNTPVRRKFLKSPQTELQKIQHQIVLYALSHPEIGFTLNHSSASGGPLLLLPSASNLRERIFGLFGRDFLEKMVEVKGEEVTGFVSRSESLRLSRSHQYLFVNNRPIQSRGLSHAIYSGYGNLEKGRHPACLLFLKINPSRVDVNVHPTKREVRFQDERNIHDLLRRTVRNTVQPRETMGSEGWPTRHEPLGSYEEGSLPLLREGPREIYPSQKREDSQSASLADPVRGWGEENRAGGRVGRVGSAGGSFPFWQLHRVYIFAQTQSGMIIVDQHNAHERVIFDEIMKIGERKERGSQKLLFPLVMDLTPKEWEVLEEHFDPIQELGFEMKRLSGRTLVIEGVPMISTNFRSHTPFGQERMRDLLDELSALGGSGKPRLRNFEAVVKGFACKSAIKKGESLSVDEMNALMDRLFATENPYICPHGRPIIIRMPMEELDRRFGRT